MSETDLPGERMYRHWSVEDHLRNLEVVLSAAIEGKATPLDLVDARNQIAIVRRKLKLAASHSERES
jgi:hypothetical protein